VVTIVKKNAEKLAVKYRPIIYQEWKDIRDFLTPLILHNSANMLEEMKKPTLYYKVMEDGRYWYISTVVYHPWDWSDHPIWFIRKWDSHRHDTESILMRIEKKKSEGLSKKVPKGANRIDICTVFHSSFIFKKYSDRQVYIEPEGHGIKPFNPKMLKEDRNFIRYNKYDFVDWATIKEAEWEQLRKKLKGVNLPDKQFDGQFKLRFRTKGEMNHLPGDNWNRPDVLFRQAKISNRI